MRIMTPEGKFIESEDIKELKIVTNKGESALLYSDYNGNSGAIIDGTREEMLNLVEEMNKALQEGTAVVAIYRH